MLRKIGAGIAATLLTAAALTACTTTPEPDPVPLDERLVQEATAAAEAISGGEQLGGTVTVLGTLGGDQLDAYLAAFAPFEEVTGIDVQYEGTRDLLAVLETRVQGGNAPDVVANPSIGQMAAFMESGDLIALDEFLDTDAVAAQYDAGLLDLGSYDGHLYGLLNTAALKGLVYYNPEAYEGPIAPATWDELSDWADDRAASGSTPWCIGVESGAASGWLATDWIEQFLLTGAGADVWDEWAAGDLAWTSDEVREAFEQFGAIATDPEQVNGGATAVVSTDFLQAALPLWSDPARCDLTLQADWLQSTVPGQVEGVTEGEQIDFFLFPAVSDKGAGLVETAGDMIGAFNDTPQVEQFLQYAAGPESQALIASTGMWLSANKEVTLDAYPTDSRRKAAELLASATGVRFDGSDLMPQPVLEAFWAATLGYLADPSSLDAQLEKIEAVRTS